MWDSTREDSPTTGCSIARDRLDKKPKWRSPTGWIESLPSAHPAGADSDRRIGLRNCSCHYHREGFGLDYVEMNPVPVELQRRSFECLPSQYQDCCWNREGFQAMITCQNKSSHFHPHRLGSTPSEFGAQGLDRHGILLKDFSVKT